MMGREFRRVTSVRQVPVTPVHFKHWRPKYLGLLLLLWTLLMPSWALAQTAEELIPFKKLPVKLRKELWKVCKRCTVRRKLPDKTALCKEATFHYLLRRLPLASRLVRKLKLGDYVIKDIDKGDFSISDSDGAFANCDIVVKESSRVVIVARGYIESGLFPKVYGTGVIVIRTSDIGTSSKPKLKADCRVYFRLKDKYLHTATRAFRKTLARVLEKRLLLFVDCAIKIAEFTQKDPNKVIKAMRSLKEKKELIADFKKRFVKGP